MKRCVQRTGRRNGREVWKRTATDYVLLEEDTPWQSRDTPNKTVAGRQPVLELGNPQKGTASYGGTYAEAVTLLKELQPMEDPHQRRYTSKGTTAHGKLTVVHKHP